MPGPLTGLRVIELAGIGPSPFAAMMLADLGADVLRLDRPGGPGFAYADPALDLLNRGRPNAVVDLKHADGRAVVLDLVERADVLLEANRPGVTERLGLGPQDCWDRNPRLVYGRMTGWGQTGPLAHTAGHDVGYIAITGALHPIGRAGGPPQIPLNLVGDFGGGALFLVAGVLAALWESARSGRGQIVDANIVDGTSLLTTQLHGLLAAGLWSGGRGENLLDTGAPYYDVYETADGEHLAVGALEPRFYAALLDGLGLVADLPDRLPDRDDPAQWPALRARLATRIAERTRAQWTEIFDGTDACVAPVLTPAEAAAHPHLRERSTFVTAHGVTQPAPAPRFSRTPAELGSAPAEPGQDTVAALTAWGITGIEDLLTRGVIVQSGQPQELGTTQRKGGGR